MPTLTERYNAGTPAHVLLAEAEEGIRELQARVHVLKEDQRMDRADLELHETITNALERGYAERGRAIRDALVFLSKGGLLKPGLRQVQETLRKALDS